MVRMQWIATAGLACLAPVAFALPTGDETAPDYSFRSPVLNGMGIKSLAELRGKPLLIEFWGTR
jgi:hypothetical protein